MAQERVVKVKLTAQMDNYLAGMEKARKVTQDTASEAQKLADTKRQFDQLGRASLAAGALVAVGLGVAIAKFAEFDQAMSNVAATGADARANMEALTDAALEAGATTVFSATEAAGAIENLAKAGLDSSDILGGALTASLDLAAAGGLAVADAAEIAATTLQQFGLEGEDATHVADLLAAGAGKAMGDVSDMSQALKQSGLVANQFGISVEETVGTLSAFASAGLLGSDAGTSFRTMLLRLANPTEEVKDLMAEVGINAYDAGGQFIGLSGLAGQLETALAGMTDQQKQTTLAQIFGQDAIRGATVLYEEGADGIAEWTNKVDDAGYAAETAQTRLDNLKGDIEALTGALDTAFISMGEAADGPLRGLVQALTGLVDKFNELPAGAQQATFWVGAVGAAGAIALGSYLLLVPKMAEFKLALDVLGPSATRASRAVAAIGKGVGITAVVAATVTLASNALIDYARELRGTDEAVAKATTTNQSFLESMEELKVTTEASAGDVKRALDDMASGNILGGSGTNIQVLRDALTELGKGFEGLPLEDSVAKFQAWGDELGLSEKQMKTMLDELPTLRKAIQDHLKANGDAADAQSVLNFALEDGAEAAEEQKAQLESLQGVAVDTETDVNSLADAIRNFGTAQFDTERASLDFQGALADLSATLVDGDGNLVGSLDKTTEAGQNTLGAMLDVAQSTNDYAASVAAMGGSTEEVQGILEAGRQKIIDTRISLGDTEEAARLYADQLIATPATIETQVQLNGIESAKSAMESFIRSYDNRSIGISAKTIAGNPSLGYIPGNADGGAIEGPGGPRSDNILRRLSPGEHVLTAADVAAMGGQHAVYGFRAGLQSGSGGLGNNINVNVTAAAGMDEESVARRVVSQIERRLK